MMIDEGIKRFSLATAQTSKFQSTKFWRIELSQAPAAAAAELNFAHLHARTGDNLTIHSSPMSQSGHSRRFDRAPMTSGVPR
jgi:hypothetical protein